MQCVRPIAIAFLAAVCTGLFAAAPAHAQADVWSDKAFLDVNVGLQLSANPFEEHLAPIIYSERGSVTVAHAGSAPWTTVDLGGGVRVWKGLGVGATYSKLGFTEDVTVAALVPNPVQFNQTRAASKVMPAERKEKAFHTHVLYVRPVTPRIDVMFSAGPSFIELTQDFVTGLELAEGEAPFVTVAIGNVQTVARTERIFGFNGGAGVTYFLTPLMGLGGTIRYSSGGTTTQQGDGRAVDLSRGGFQLLFGARVRFR
jgi:opacity protein-like surface antigen